LRAGLAGEFAAAGRVKPSRNLTRGWFIEP
jgi:hypothetical protein